MRIEHILEDIELSQEDKIRKAMIHLLRTTDLSSYAISDVFEVSEDIVLNLFNEV